MQKFKEIDSESELHEYCKYHFRVNHNGIAQLMYEMFHNQYAFVFQGGVGTWYKRLNASWESVAGLEYKLRNKISDEVYKVVAYSGWKPICMDVDPTQALMELEFMLGTHEDKMAILREMEARFLVLEVPIIQVKPETANVGPKPMEFKPKEIKPKETKKVESKNMNPKFNSKSSWKGSD